MLNYDLTIERYLSELKLLLSKEKIQLNNNPGKIFPKKGGVYIVWEENRHIYVGKSSNLKNRICGNHLSGNKRGSTLRNKLLKKRFSDENEVSEYLRDKCSIQFIEIEESSYRSFFEHFVISVLKPEYNS